MSSACDWRPTGRWRAGPTSRGCRRASVFSETAAATPRRCPPPSGRRPARRAWPKTREAHGVLQAVGSAGTTLRFLAGGTARARFEEAALRAQGARLIDGWVDAIYAGLIGGAMPRDCEALQPPSTVRLEPSTTASSRRGVAWFGHAEGQSSLLGEVGAADARTTDSLLDACLVHGFHREQGRGDDHRRALGAGRRMGESGCVPATPGARFAAGDGRAIRQRAAPPAAEAGRARGAHARRVHGARGGARCDDRVAGAAPSRRGGQRIGRAGHARGRLSTRGRGARAVAEAGIEARRGLAGRSRRGRRQNIGGPRAPGAPGGQVVAERQRSAARPHRRERQAVGCAAAGAVGRRLLRLLSRRRYAQAGNGGCRVDAGAARACVLSPVSDCRTVVRGRASFRRTRLSKGSAADRRSRYCRRRARLGDAGCYRCTVQLDHSRRGTGSARAGHAHSACLRLPRRECSSSFDGWRSPVSTAAWVRRCRRPSGIGCSAFPCGSFARTAPATSRCAPWASTPYARRCPGPRSPRRSGGCSRSRTSASCSTTETRSPGGRRCC